MRLSQLYHQSIKEFSDSVKQSTPDSTWPEEWKTTYLKKYERFPKIMLPAPTHLENNLVNVILSRRSRRVFDKTIHKEDLSNLLYYSVGEIDRTIHDGVGRRVYPSAGTRYPLECYVLVFEAIDDICPGIYHYGVEDHNLSLILDKKIDTVALKTMVGYAFLHTAKCAVLITGIVSRSFPKYKDRAYKYILLEGGIVTQNFSLVAEALLINSVSIGILSDDVVEDILDIDGTDEIFVHSIFFG